MIDDAITTVGFALQSYVNTCIHEDTEENRAERVELTLAWSIIKSHLNMSGVDMPEDKLQPQRGH
jgi:hypothetical protein